MVLLYRTKKRSYERLKNMKNLTSQNTITVQETVILSFIILIYAPFIVISSMFMGQFTGQILSTVTRTPVHISLQENDETNAAILLRGAKNNPDYYDIISQLSENQQSAIFDGFKHAYSEDNLSEFSVSLYYANLSGHAWSNHYHRQFKPTCLSKKDFQTLPVGTMINPTINPLCGTAYYNGRG